MKKKMKNNLHKILFFYSNFRLIFVLNFMIYNIFIILFIIKKSINNYMNRNNVKTNNIRTNNIKTNNTNTKPISQSVKNKLGELLNKLPSRESIDTTSIFKTIGIIILIIVFIYIGICLYTFYTTECYEKKSFFQHLIDFNPIKVCIQKDPPPPPPQPKEQDAVKLLPLLESKEVFHISNQKYTFDQAKCKCESYGAKLATKQNLIDAYNKGANWCTYGWSEGQNAFYPVQQCEWDKLNEEMKKHPEHSHERKKLQCGNPGLNGGHFANAMLKFGVNCYGKKPKGENSNKMKKPYCPPMNFCKLEDNYDASHKLDSDDIAPFNGEKWSSAGNTLF